MSDQSVVPIPANTPLYKGDTEKYVYQYLPEKVVTFDRNLGPVFFALDGVVPGKDVAATYGVVFEFTTTEPLNLVNLDNVGNLEFLFAGANKTIQRILLENYGYKPTKSSIGKRNSVHSADKTFSEFLCQKGYDGYISEKATTDFSGTFHKEMMLCDVSKIRFSRLVSTPTEIGTAFGKLRNKYFNMRDVNNKSKGSKERKDPKEELRLLILNYDNRNDYSETLPGTPPKKPRTDDGYGTPGGAKRSLRKKSANKKRKNKRTNTKKRKI